MNLVNNKDLLKLRLFIKVIIKEYIKTSILSLLIIRKSI
jgi:hypothetical protein